MASERNRVALRQLRTLFHSGTFTGLTDGQLLERFGNGRDDAAEVAFAALVDRHGAMVLRTCHAITRDDHDAEDAFQATFLILAKKGRSLWVRDSIGPWLHRVARRAAIRACAAADRRRVAERRAARPEAALIGTSSGADWLPILHEEIDLLPERYRVPVILCDLEGRSYEEAARHMDCPIGTIMSRLARGRQRLQGSLTRRGVAPALAASAAAMSVEASAGVVVPMALAGSIVGGSVSKSVIALVGEVSKLMLLTKLKTMVGGCLASVLVGGGSLLAWQAVPSATDGRQNDVPRRIAQAEKPRPKPVESKPKPVPKYQFVGSVKVEGTGEPVKGAKFNVILSASNFQGGPWKERDVESGDDGTFDVDLPAGQARAWTLFPPPGYWMPNDGQSRETFIVSRSHPVQRTDYVVKRGKVWNFRLEQGKDRKPVSGGMILVASSQMAARAVSDDQGMAKVTLPAEGGKFTLQAISRLTLGERAVTLALEAGKGPALKVTFGNETVAPTQIDGKPVFRIHLPDQSSKTYGALSGWVVDVEGRPIEAARVQIGVGGAQSGGMTEVETQTNDQGRFQFRMPTDLGTDAGGGESKFFAVVTKSGYSGVDTPMAHFRPGVDGSAHVLAPITLKPGNSLSGKVVGPNGQPIEGAWVVPSGSYAVDGAFTRTDENGRFTVKDLPRGLVQLSVAYGKLAADRTNYLVGSDGKGVEPEIRLRPLDDVLAEVKSPTLKPPEVGQAAPEWEVRDWTDGKARKLAEQRGKIVVLDFWGIWCRPCVAQLPVLEVLRKKYEPRGVVFVSVHTAGERVDRIRRFLEFSKSTLVSAVDAGVGKNVNGATADRYGVTTYPTLVLIDRTGKITFRSDDQSRTPKIEAIMHELGIDPKTGTEAQNHLLVETIFDREIEALLKRP